MGDRSPCARPAKPIVTMRRRHPRRSNAARRSDATWSSAWSAAAAWARSTPRTIPSWIARSRSSCCASHAGAARDRRAAQRGCCARRRRSRGCRTRTSSPSTTSGTFDDRVFIAMEFVDGHTLGDWLQRPAAHAGARSSTSSRGGRGPGRGARSRARPPRLQARQRDGRRATARCASWTSAWCGRDRPREARRADADAPAVHAARARRYDPYATHIIDAPARDLAVGTSAVSDALGLNLTRVGDDARHADVHVARAVPGEPADARSDQFSFCVALYEALYGERPFAAASITELAANVTRGKVRPEPAGVRVPASIRKALLRGLSVDPDARFPSMDALLADAAARAGARSGARRLRRQRGVAKLEPGVLGGARRRRPATG